MKPTMCVGCLPSIARRQARTTSSTHSVIRNTTIERTPAPIASMNGASTGPGLTAPTCNPRPLYSAHSASESDSTNALFAP